MKTLILLAVVLTAFYLGAQTHQPTFVTGITVDGKTYSRLYGISET